MALWSREEAGGGWVKTPDEAQELISGADAETRHREGGVGEEGVCVEDDGGKS